MKKVLIIIAIAVICGGFSDGGDFAQAGTVVIARISVPNAPTYRFHCPPSPDGALCWPPPAPRLY